MARMHRRRRGKSSSKRPHLEKAPAWVSLKSEEIEKLILKFNQDDLSTAEIGIRLRDQYGVPSVKLVTGKTITQILREKGVEMELPEDLRNLMMKAVRLDSHLKEHHKDLHNRRSLELIEAKIRRLANYYKREGVLPPEWQYSREAAEIQVR